MKHACETFVSGKSWSNSKAVACGHWLEIAKLCFFIFHEMSTSCSFASIKVSMAERGGKNETWTIYLLLNFRSVLFTSKIKSRNVFLALKQERLDCNKVNDFVWLSSFFLGLSVKKQGETGLTGKVVDDYSALHICGIYIVLHRSGVFIVPLCFSALMFLNRI